MDLPESMPPGGAAESSAAIGLEARVALVEVHLARRGVAAPGLELRGRGGDAVGARLGGEVPHALRHGLHGARAPTRYPPPSGATAATSAPPTAAGESAR